MGHEIKPVQFNDKDKDQKWKLDGYNIKTRKKDKTSKFFKLCLVEEPEKTETVEQKDPKKPKIDTKTCVSANNHLNQFESKQDCGGIIAANVENFRTFEGNTRKVISVLLGFFVATIVKRWWDQTAKIPRLDKLAISLNAIMQEGKNLIYKKIRLDSKVLCPLKLCFDSLPYCWLIVVLTSVCT